jgi:hypothetical protein
MNEQVFRVRRVARFIPFSLTCLSNGRFTRTLQPSRSLEPSFNPGLQRATDCVLSCTEDGARLDGAVLAGEKKYTYGNLSCIRCTVNATKYFMMHEQSFSVRDCVAIAQGLSRV